MNCRPGDLAIVIRSSAANNGKAVTCLELVSAASLNISPEEGPLWRIDRELEWENELGKFQGSVVPDWGADANRTRLSDGSLEGDRQWLSSKRGNRAIPVGAQS